MADVFAWYAVLSILLAVVINPSWPPLMTIPTMTLVMLLLTYFLIYLITPLNIDWHLQHSLNRLMLQLLPLGAFIYFGFLGSVIRNPKTLRAASKR